MALKKYIVDFGFTKNVSVEVEAGSESEAEDKARDMVAKDSYVVGGEITSAFFDDVGEGLATEI